MRRVLLIAMILGCCIAAAEARHRGRHYRPYAEVIPGASLLRSGDAVRPRSGAGSREPITGVQDSTGAQSGSSNAGVEPGQAARDMTAYLVPDDWQLQPPDPNWRGKRFLSPDGAGWFAIYTTSTQQEPIAAHMKAIAFVEGEEITHLQGERSWIAVAGFKGDRIFYRKAVLACAGDRWHHVAFEYPAAAKHRMEGYMNRAAEAVQASRDSGCDAPVTVR